MDKKSGKINEMDKKSPFSDGMKIRFWREKFMGGLPCEIIHRFNKRIGKIATFANICSSDRAYFYKNVLPTEQ